MRSVRPPFVVMLLAWLLVVAVVGVVTYVVVGSAGRDVGQASAAVAPLPQASGSPAAVPTPAPSASEPTPRPTRTETPKPQVTRTSAPAPAPTRIGASAAPPATRTATPPPAPSSTTRSFTTQGGTVVATCTGSTLRLDSITPRDGWRVENEAEHGVLEVKFKSAETEIEVTLRCVDGVPTRVGD